MDEGFPSSLLRSAAFRTRPRTARPGRRSPTGAIRRSIAAPFLPRRSWRAGRKVLEWVERFCGEVCAWIIKRTGARPWEN